MKRRSALARVGLLLGMGGGLYVAWASSAARRVEVAAPARCTCELERTRSGWCEACGQGYVADVEIRSRTLYDALDAHGHDIDVQALVCESCRAAVRSDGFCTQHGRGFVGGRAYLSRLSYHLARGEPEKVEEELSILHAAVKTAERCELCAGAMVIDGTCPECRLSYRGGVASPLH